MNGYVPFIVAAHVSDIYGPVQALVRYLRAERKDFVFIEVPFAYAKLDTARTTLFRGGEVAEVRRGHANRGDGLLRWWRDYRYVRREGRRFGGPKTRFIGINAVNALAGQALRGQRCCREVTYYVIDYTPRRFASAPLNHVYQTAVKRAALGADAVWNLSERMRQVHARFGVRPGANRLVPVGVDTGAVVRVRESEIDRRRMVAVSALFESKGIQRVIDALPDLPGATLAVVGTGPYEPALRERARARGVADRVAFKGLMEHDALFAYLPTCGVALATYMPDAGSYTYYADPTKPKEYLACGVPVVITRVLWVAEVIHDRPMGVAVEYDAASIAQGCRRLLEDDAFWKQCRDNALAYAGELDWKVIYNEAFAGTEPERADGAASGRSRG